MKHRISQAPAGVPLLLFVASLSGCWLSDNQSDNQLSLSGNIELKKVEVAFKVPGKLIELTVDEGDLVKASDVVSKLDPEQYEKQLARARAEADALHSKKRELDVLLRYQIESVEAQIAQRAADVRRTQAALDLLRSGSRKQEIESARALVEAAEAQAEIAARDWERAQNLYRAEDISTAQYESYKAVYESAQARLTEVRERFRLVREGPRTEEIRQAEARLDQSLAAQRQAEAARHEIERIRKSIETIEAQIRASEAQVKVIETSLKDTVAVTPIDGVVLEKLVENGEVIAPGTPVVTVGDLAHPWVRGYIEESELGHVKLGGAAIVTTDSHPGKSYRGRVAFIASEAEFTPKQIQTREERVKLVYRIKVEVENPDFDLKLNMPVDVLILLGSE